MKRPKQLFFFHLSCALWVAETSENKSYHLGEFLCCLACMVFITIIRKIHSLQEVYFRVPPSVQEPDPNAGVFGPPRSASTDKYFPFLIKVLSGLKNWLKNKI